MSLPINDQEAGLISAMLHDMAENPEFRRVALTCMRKTLLPWEISVDDTNKYQVPCYCRKNLLGKVVTPPRITSTVQKASVDDFFRGQKFKVIE